MTPSPQEVMRGSQWKGRGQRQPENNGAERGGVDGVPRLPHHAVNLITSPSPRPPLSSSLRIPTWREKLLNPPLYF